MSKARFTDDQLRSSGLQVNAPAGGHHFMTLGEVIEFTTMPRSTLYYQIEHGRFPKAVRIGARKVAWKRADVMAWFESLSVS
ncbi:AlpA family phage regulatory protein [Herbaspirillum sp. ST 5-3]|uniref:helix-turn-helix transcriptional regulator n=1 Tax=Oxalobacteraceae TaxID=75682 RepID=UPI001FFF4661|nr:AlpA family phage regulatory protein [Herbaspirillum sp. ST 5-3]